MKCIVTAGPTYEPLDEVRRLTNSSTGRLGSGLANFLAAEGHEVTLLLGQQATHHEELKVVKTLRFTTTANLREQLQSLAGDLPGAIFHAAAVSDFGFGKIFAKSADGKLVEIKSRKIPTRVGGVMAELTPTPKIIAELRDWHPGARLVGWKLEMEGGRAEVIRLAQRQIAECRTDACVANGPAYGKGFGLVTGAGNCVHLADRMGLYEALAGLIRK